MYEVIPKKSNKAAHYTSAVLLIAAFAAMFFSASPKLPYRSLMQFAALIMLGFSILMMTRYTLCSYAYSIIEEDGEYDLTVTELKRKARITVCRVGLGGITQLTLAKRADKEQSSCNHSFFHFISPVRVEMQSVYLEISSIRMLSTQSSAFGFLIAKLTAALPLKFFGVRKEKRFLCQSALPRIDSFGMKKFLPANTEIQTTDVMGISCLIQ